MLGSLSQSKHTSDSKHRCLCTANLWNSLSGYLRLLVSAHLTDLHWALTSEWISGGDTKSHISKHFQTFPFWRVCFFNVLMTFSELKVTLGQSGVFLQLFSSLFSSFQPLSTLLSLAQGSQSAHFLQPRTTTLLFFFFPLHLLCCCYTQ